MEAKLLIVLSNPAAAESCLAAAERVVHAIPHPRIDVLHVRVDPETTIMPTEEVLTASKKRHLRSEAALEGLLLRGVYEGWQSRLGHYATTEWHDVIGTEASEITLHSSGAALIVIGRPSHAPHGYDRQALDAALFDTGRLLLVVPPDLADATFGQHIMVAWKESKITHRAILAAQPWLLQAKRVSVVQVGEGQAGELLEAERLLDSMEIEASFNVVSKEGQTIGHRILSEVNRIGADSLVMGAYRHRPAIEWVIGGATADVLRHTHVPVWLLH